MPDKKSIFTPSSILFRPQQQRTEPKGRRPFLVEAPGTAPGSDGFIAPPVYCHSRLRDSRDISPDTPYEKALREIHMLQEDCREVGGLSS